MGWFSLKTVFINTALMLPIHTQLDYRAFNFTIVNT